MSFLVTKLWVGGVGSYVRTLAGEEVRGGACGDEVGSDEGHDGSDGGEEGGERLHGDAQVVVGAVGDLECGDEDRAGPRSTCHSLYNEEVRMVTPDAEIGQ